METKNIKIFQKNIGDFYIGNVVQEDETFYYCENYFVILANTQANPEGAGVRVGLTMLPDDLIEQKPPVFLRSFLPELKDTPYRVKKSDCARTIDPPDRLISDYELWVSRVENATSTQSVNVPTEDDKKIIKLFGE
jgi:hypothetical protein